MCYREKHQDKYTTLIPFWLFARLWIELSITKDQNYKNVPAHRILATQQLLVLLRRLVFDLRP